MELHRTEQGFALYKEKDCIGECRLSPAPKGAQFAALCILPRWRRKGYGSYLLKEVLRSFGGYDREAATVFTAPLPENAAELAFWGKFGFAAEGGQLVRRRTPDLTAVKFVQDFLAARLVHPQLCVDATCGNGHDTEFLCRLAGPTGRVLALDIQPAAVENTNTRLGAAGLGAIGQALVHDHARLAELVAPGTADCVLFNFGWLPGADHEVHSTADGSLPALQAALDALKPRGVLAAVLYSGQVIGDSEKQAALGFFRALPLTKYTVLVCEFANWASTAPLPCFVIKK